MIQGGGSFDLRPEYKNPHIFLNKENNNKKNSPPKKWRTKLVENVRETKGKKMCPQNNHNPNNYHSREKERQPEIRLRIYV